MQTDVQAREHVDTPIDERKDADIESGNMGVRRDDQTYGLTGGQTCRTEEHTDGRTGSVDGLTEAQMYGQTRPRNEYRRTDAWLRLVVWTDR